MSQSARKPKLVWDCTLGDPAEEGEEEKEADQIEAQE